MTAYLISNFDVDDPEAFRAYQKLAAPALGIGDGVEVIAHDMATDQLEGRPAGKLTIILKFESAEAARSAYNSEAYQQLNPQRLSSTSNQTGLIVEGL